jgi:hypothetical protein
MRKFLISSAIISLAVAGCTKESTPAGPGAKTNTTTTTTERSYREPDSDRTFTLKVPAGTTNIKRGDRESVTISLNRGRDFKEVVTLKFSPPIGITVEPTEVQLKADQSEAKVMLDVADEAAVGEKVIDVTATPATGKPASMSMKVKVDTK